MRFWRRNPELEDRLRAERPEPGAHLVRAIEDQIEATSRRPGRYRPTRTVYALALTTALMGALAAFGGLSYAAVSVGDSAARATKIVKVTVGLEAAKPSASARSNSSADATAAASHTICHVPKRGDPQTLTLSEKEAQRHLRNHPNDYDGPCRPECDDDDPDDDEYCEDDDGPNATADRRRQ